MIRLSFNLPKYRLSVQIAKRRASALEEPLLPELEEIQNIRSGSKISRFFRHIFEHKNIKKILGANLAFMLIAGSLIPGNILAQNESIQEEMVLTVPNTPLTTEKGVQSPVSTVKINQGYRFFHPGVDLGGKTGDSVRPIMRGKVEEIQYSRFAYGNAILVNHGNSITSLYAHLSEIEVEPGQEVGKEDIIGKMGSTGHSSGPHLHLEIHERGRPINPSTILPK